MMAMQRYNEDLFLLSTHYVPVSSWILRTAATDLASWKISNWSYLSNWYPIYLCLVLTS